MTVPIENNNEKSFTTETIKCTKQTSQKNKEIYITSVVKRNGIIKINKNAYDEKKSLLNDTDTCENKIEQKIFAETQKINI